MTTNSTITVHTDGVCMINPGVGGWGAVIESETKRLCIGNMDMRTTNQQMELTAVTEALKELEKYTGRPIHVYTVSTYLVQGMTEWLNRWKANGWLGSDRKLIKNLELWRLLAAQSEPLDLYWHLVKGHSKNAGSKLADAIANRAIAEGRIYEAVMKRPTPEPATEPRGNAESLAATLP